MSGRPAKPWSVRDRIAKLLQKSLPVVHGKEVEWRPEYIYPARGIWKHKKMDVQSWSATCIEKGSTRTVTNVGCWFTMTACLKSDRMIFGEDPMEVWPDPEPVAVHKGRWTTWRRADAPAQD